MPQVLPFVHNELTLSLIQGTIWITYRAPEGDLTCKLTPSHTLNDLLQWLCDPTTQASTMLKPSEKPWHSRSVSYNHLNGKLELHTGRTTFEFDPLDEEDLARLIRRLKSLAPLPSSETSHLPIPLPTVTAEDLAFKRTIFSTPMAAAGAQKPKYSQSGRFLANRSDIDNLMTSLAAELKQ